MSAGRRLYYHLIQVQIGDVIKESCGCNQFATPIGQSDDDLHRALDHALHREQGDAGGNRKSPVEWPISGSVLDVEMTMLDKQSKGIPIDEQAKDNVVHLDRFRE